MIVKSLICKETLLKCGMGGVGVQNRTEQDNLNLLKYLMQILSMKGISHIDVVRESLTNLIQLYETTGDAKYVEVAVCQMKVAAELNVVKEEDSKLYQNVMELAGWTEYDQMVNRIYEDRRIKVNKTQVKSMFRKWMPSSNNPMTIGQVVEDIIYKVKNHIEGHFYYCYDRNKGKGENISETADVYLLVVEADRSYFWDCKGFVCYTFQVSYEKDKG